MRPLPADAVVDSIAVIASIKRRPCMAQLTVRNLSTEVVRALKRRAAAHDRSAEAEHRAILESILRPDGGDFWQRAARLREQTRGRAVSDSTDLIRADRDRDTE